MWRQRVARASLGCCAVAACALVLLAALSPAQQPARTPPSSGASSAAETAELRGTAVISRESRHQGFPEARVSTTRRGADGGWHDPTPGASRRLAHVSLPPLSSSRNVPLRLGGKDGGVVNGAGRWSSSRCKGSAGMAGEFPSHQRSCHFRNLCWDLRHRTWLYHARPYLDPPVVFDGKDGMYGFERLPAAQGVHEWPPGKGGAGNKPVRVKVVKGAIPGSPTAVWSPVPWSVFSRFWMWNNIGHVLGDGVLGVFWLQSVFGQYDRGNQMLMDLSVENKRRTNGKHGAWNSGMARLVHPGLSGRPIVDVNDASGLQGFSSTATRMVCFENVLMGAGTLQFARRSPSSKAWMQGIRMNGASRCCRFRRRGCTAVLTA